MDSSTQKKHTGAKSNMLAPLHRWAYPRETSGLELNLLGFAKWLLQAAFNSQFNSELTFD